MGSLRGRISNVKTRRSSVSQWYESRRKQEAELRDDEKQPERAEALVAIPSSKPKQKAAPVKDDGICPMCERPAVIHKLYAKNTYNVHGQEITVRESVFACTRCGERWSNTLDGERDGLEKAYTIYTKRKKPETRKFKRLRFNGGEVYVTVCASCVKSYGLKSKITSSLTKRTSLCDSKGCKEYANYVLPFGQL